MIVLDSDVLIEIFDKHSPSGEGAYNRIKKSGELFCTTVINLHEVLYGIYKYGNPTENITGLSVLEYLREDAILSAELELKAEKIGRKIRRADSMIAAISINNKGKLYTFDKDHFKWFVEHGLNLFA